MSVNKVELSPPGARKSVPSTVPRCPGTGLLMLGTPVESGDRVIEEVTPRFTLTLDPQFRNTNSS